MKQPPLLSSATSRSPLRIARGGPRTEQGRERSELQRQGAKAAARGEQAETNPMHEVCNRPESTGETRQTWMGRCTAWDEGFEHQADQDG